LKIVVSTALVLGLTALSFASVKAKPAQQIDSGSFEILLNGKTIGTETFQVEQRAEMSVAKSDLKVDGDDVAQHSEMEIAPNGDLLRYSWTQSKPDKSELAVERTEEYLTEKVSAGKGPNEKAYNVPHMMPHSTAILDDNFFLHRELLLWRYLASGCSQKTEGLTCSFTPQQYGVLIPAQHASENVTVNFKGKETIQLRGKPVEVSSFVLQTDEGDWVLYLDAQEKLVKVVMEGQNVEVVRN
jgi:hypothetical protein